MKALSKVCIMADTVIAGEALAANRFVTSAGAYPAADGNWAYGVTAAKAASGEAVPVDCLGIAVVDTTEAAIAVGAQVQADTEGKVKKQAGGGVAVGRALTAVPAAGGQIRVFLTPN